MLWRVLKQQHATLLLNISVVLKEIDSNFLQKGINLITGNLEGLVKKGLIPKEKMSNALKLVKGTMDYSEFSDVDMVIETVDEKILLKQTIFEEIEKICPPHCILATNTSTIDLNVIGEKTCSQDRIIGAHFFSPAHLMSLLEIVHTKKTSPQVILDVLTLAKSIAKFPVVSQNCTGFAVNRTFFPYSQSAHLLASLGVDLFLRVMNPKSYRPTGMKKITTTSSPPGSCSALIKDQQPKTFGCYLKTTYRLFFPYLIILIFLPSFLFFFAPPSSYPNLWAEARSDENVPVISTPQSQRKETNLITATFCPTLIDEEEGEHVGMLCCDRSHHRTDVCYMKGDIRTDVARSSSIFLYNISGEDHPVREKIRPYTRKWETSVMSTIDELSLIPVTKFGRSGNNGMKCDVHHTVPAVVLSTGGYTGNLYHDFNDGLIPLYLTTERFNGEVILLVLEYHSWWMSRYNNVVKKLSNYEIVDLGLDRRVHCFPTMIVGMKIHGELSIDPQLMPDGKGIQNFQALLHESFDVGSSRSTNTNPHDRKRPKLTIFIRKESRVILNPRQLIKKCRSIGFQVEILNPKRTTPLSEIHSALSTSDVMVAVHGAAMTHFMLVRPGSFLIQIVPLGLNWAADEYYGQPARKLGLEYVEYRVGPSESSLSKEYGLNHPIITDPTSITCKGWEETKRIYLGHQNVTLDIRRFAKVLSRVYSDYIHRTNKKHHATYTS